ncbi:carboxypeptidase-like regulatory domain-containing protein [Reichenbachiella agarivorans]|uniref:Carboxypeptidase-like regulatory domain-containing protein n=1 Tax=Reichenbachiella agarivorans TaxID=2979464 RepID=A0ABY6CQ06_9BACT|nr:carboxypeptidase-like regulatory domain-containing protein [Reichenbachiella agarivorans]UXP32602.1 carboxypeptidase-like regulatory domain-containing protein [Reichenbachiella agarivorans]
MKLLIYTLLCVISICLHSHASELTHTSISGQILDSETREPLAFANIIYGNHGTTSNMDGHFVLNTDHQNKETRLIIKYIGYETATLTLEDGGTGLVIELKPESKVLDGVTIYTADDVIKDVIHFHQINYEFKDQLLHSYYKESIQSDGDYYYIAEGLFSIYLPTIYSDNKLAVSARKTRKKEFVSLDTVKIPMIQGHVTDMVDGSARRKGSFLDADYINNYKFTKDEVTTYDGREVFKITYEPINKKATSQGTIFIDIESKAIIKAEYYPTLDRQTFWTNVMWTEEYKEIDGTWYIHRVSYQGEWEYKNKKYAYDALMVVTDFKNVSKKPYFKDELTEDAVFFKEASVFSDTFWANDTHLELTETERVSFAKK